MITLITGVPGSGKTALAVKLLQEESQKRLLFVDGIRELKIPHEPVPPIDTWVTVSQTPAGGEEYEWMAFPPGSLICVDECQRYFRPRHVSKAPPAAVAGFETHRHAGLDFYLMTQDATFLDSNVRKLVDRHIHIQDSWLGRFSYTAMRCFDPTSKTELNSASRQKYSPPPSSFPLYKSAEVHTERKKPMPIMVYVGALSVVALIFLVWRTVDSVKNKDQSIAAERSEGNHDKTSKDVGSRRDTETWRVVGWIGHPMRIVLSDGYLRRIALPEKITYHGDQLEVHLYGGQVVRSWSGPSALITQGKTE